MKMKLDQDTCSFVSKEIRNMKSYMNGVSCVLVSLVGLFLISSGAELEMGKLISSVTIVMILLISVLISFLFVGVPEFRCYSEQKDPFGEDCAKSHAVTWEQKRDVMVHAFFVVSVPLIAFILVL